MSAVTPPEVSMKSGIFRHVSQRMFTIDRLRPIVGEALVGSGRVIQAAIPVVGLAFPLFRWRQLIAYEPADRALDGVRIVTAFRFQITFGHERVDFRFV
jgi:hypothetical protein